MQFSEGVKVVYVHRETAAEGTFSSDMTDTDGCETAPLWCFQNTSGVCDRHTEWRSWCRSDGRFLLKPIWFPGSDYCRCTAFCRSALCPRGGHKKTRWSTRSVALQQACYLPAESSESVSLSVSQTASPRSVPANTPISRKHAGRAVGKSARLWWRWES